MGEYSIISADTGAKEMAETLSHIFDEYGDRLTEQQVSAIPLLAYGSQPKDVAKYINTTTDTVRQWLSTNMDFRAALARAKSAMEGFHKQMLDQAGVFAWGLIIEKLSEQNVDVGSPLDEQRVKIALDIVRHLAPGKERGSTGMNINVPILNVSGESANLIAQRLHEMNTPDVIDSDYEIVEDFVGIACAPGTMFGEMSHSVNGLYICHMCGGETRDIIIHARNDHQISPARYRKLFRIPSDIVLAPIMDENEQ